MSDLVKVYRGDGVEAAHRVSIAVVGPGGALTHYVGDPQLNVMSRSSIKPFQILPLFISGAVDHFRFSDRQIAIMCGSHNGSDQHREVVMANLDAAGNGVEHLQCGCQVPLGFVEEGRTPQNGEDTDPARHNCSGKHSGFLAQARYLKEDIDGYIDPTSRTQVFVREMIAEFCEVEAVLMPAGVDGCSAPNFGLPLVNLALGFQKLMVSSSTGAKALGDARDRVRMAMMSYPELVSGTGRFDLDLSVSFTNNIVCKIGAEALEGFGMIDPPIGVAVKIHDGSNRALGPAVVELLRQLGILKEGEENPHLERHERSKVLNARQIVTGHILPEFELKRS